MFRDREQGADSTESALTGDAATPLRVDTVVDTVWFIELGNTAVFLAGIRFTLHCSAWSVTFYDYFWWRLNVIVSWTATQESGMRKSRHQHCFSHRHTQRLNWLCLRCWFSALLLLDTEKVAQMAVCRRRGFDYTIDVHPSIKPVHRDLTDEPILPPVSTSGCYSFTSVPSMGAWSATEVQYT